MIDLLEAACSFLSLNKDMKNVLRPTCRYGMNVRYLRMCVLAAGIKLSQWDSFIITAKTFLSSWIRPAPLCVS